MLSIRRSGPVVKLGNGNLGGKAGTLLFLHRLLRDSELARQFAPHTISVPETWVLTTQCFSEFVARNRLRECDGLQDDQEVRRRFLAGRLSQQVVASLRLYLESHHLPLAVRSSALTEDTYQHPTAGLFCTVFIPNRGEMRLRQLQEAIKLVFASAYLSDVALYMRAHSIPREDEEMAVALESVVGRAHGDLYYPLVAGVAQSLNFFPVGKMQPTDGVATIVAGLGSRVVQGKDGMRFCPRHPLIRPHFLRPEEILRQSQILLDAVNLGAMDVHLTGEETDTVATVSLEQAESHGVLQEVGSVYDEESDLLYDSLLRPGRRVITFNRMLRDGSFPLPDMLARLLELIQEGFGLPIEIEFAVDRADSPGLKAYHLALLQARHLPSMQLSTEVTVPEVAAEGILIRTDRALGHGAVDGLHHMVFVDPEIYSLEVSDRVAGEVAAINERMRQQGQRYLLLGPGRWGSCNKAVGVPVRYRQIDQARLIAEISTRRLAVEPSQGTHFFHNLVSGELFYLTVDTQKEHHIRLGWLREQPGTADASLVKLIHSERPLCIRVDGRRGLGLVFWEGGSPP